jgi:serine/threonine protein kinase
MTQKHDPQALIGQRIGTYEVISMLGTGGMGDVYLARDVSLDREVALKILKPELLRDKEFEGRFTREARVIARLEHPNIVQIYAAGKAKDSLFLAMQLCKGETIDQVVRQRGALPVREALEITRKVADSLDYAHARGLMHRDIKPNNIMIDEAGSVKIMDFGLARSVVALDGMTKDGVFYGTPEYSSPEQAQTNRIDARTDIFSLGVVLYEMLTGKVPWAAETPLALFKKISEDAPLPIRHLNSKVPKNVEALVMAMLEKDRDERIQSARDVISAIDALTGGQPSPVPTRRRSSLQPWLVGAVIGVVAGLVITFFLDTSPADAGPVVPDPVPGPKVRPVKGGQDPISRSLKIVFSDFATGATDSPDDSYTIAIPDMMISQLSQFKYLDVPPRGQVLWKLREITPDATSVSDDYRRELIELLKPDLYVTGTYHLNGGEMRVHLDCYKVGDVDDLVFTRLYIQTEDNFFELIDEMTADFHQELTRNAKTILAMPIQAPASKPIASRKLFNSQFAFARDDKKAPKAEEAGELERLGEKIPDQGRGGAAPAPPPQSPPGADRALSKRSGRKAKPKGRRSIRLTRVFRNEGQIRQWVYAVRGALDRIPDRELADQLRRELLDVNADLDSLEALNTSLRSGAKGSKVYQVQIYCERHGKTCKPGEKCWNCGSDLKIVLMREGSDPRK